MCMQIDAITADQAGASTDAALDRVRASRESALARARAHEAAGAAFLPAGQRGGGIEVGDPVYEGKYADMKMYKGTPCRKVDTLAAMHRAGTISDEMLAAGRRFQIALEDYSAGDCRASDPGRVGGAGWQEPEYIRTTRWRDCKAAIAALGGMSQPCTSVCIRVLGDGLSLREWAELHPFGARCLSEKAASGVLVGALGVLVALWAED